MAAGTTCAKPYRHVLDGGDDLGALLALVRDQQQMGDFFHHPALDLLDPGLTVDHNVVKAVGKKRDDLLQIGVHLAVAAGAFRAADGQKGEAGHLHQCVKVWQRKHRQDRYKEDFICET